MNVIEIFNVLNARTSMREDQLARHCLELEAGIVVRRDFRVEYGSYNEERYEAYMQQRRNDFVVGAMAQQKAADFVDVITPKQCRNLFNRLASLQSLNYNYPFGCDARAHLMCAAIFDEGFIPAKAWAAPQQSDKIRFLYPDGSKNGMGLGWNYHVAPVVKVSTPAGLMDAVLDPCVFNAPVCLARWGEVMQTSDIVVTAYGEGPVHHSKSRSHEGDYYDDYSTTFMTDQAVLKDLEADADYWNGKEVAVFAAKRHFFSRFQR